MARYTGPKCKLCRREGAQLFLKGSRCESPKCAVVRRQQAPGQHGTSRRPPSAYGLQLREKQKVKRIYGVLEKQFRKYYKEAEVYKGEAGEYLLQLLERRLDNVVFRIGIAHSRSHARQMVRQGKITVNGKVLDIPSMRLSVGDTVGFPPVSEEGTKGHSLPSWLSQSKKDGVKIVEYPSREEIKEPVEEHLIVEYYSR